MTLVSRAQQVARGERKSAAVKIEESLKASRKLFEEVLTDNFARCFGIQLDKDLERTVERDYVRLARKNQMPLVEVFLQSGFQSQVANKDSLILIMAVCWYDLVKQHHAGKYFRTNEKHRELIQELNSSLQEQLRHEAEVFKINGDQGRRDKQRYEAFLRYRNASNFMFRSIPKMEAELRQSREAPPQSHRRSKQLAPANPVDFSQTA